MYCYVQAWYLLCTLFILNLKFKYFKKTYKWSLYIVLTGEHSTLPVKIIENDFSPSDSRDLIGKGQLVKW